MTANTCFRHTWDGRQTRIFTRSAVFLFLVTRNGPPGAVSKHSALYCSYVYHITLVQLL
jgi:hypothetical protein